jgi:hypothetical protein
MGWLIVGVGKASALAEASLQETPADRSVFGCAANQTFQIIDEPKTILPVPAFATSIQLTVEQLFSWIKQYCPVF